VTKAIIPVTRTHHEFNTKVWYDHAADSVVIRTYTHLYWAQLLGDTEPTFLVYGKVPGH
jgi:hypothetical protein